MKPLNRAYARVWDAGDTIRERCALSPLHLEFADHLELVARALHSVEMVIAGDYAVGDDVPAIRAVLGSDTDEEGA